MKNKINLQISGVEFQISPRAYILNGKILKGISKLYSKHIKDIYKDVPEWLLNERAKEGNNLHSAISVYRNSGLESDSLEFLNYLKLTKDFQHLANEYLVTDFANFATAIDDVFLSNNEIVISNTKRVKTVTYDVLESWAWQSSIEAYLFELTNPLLKVDRMIVIQVREDVSRIVELKRIPLEEVKALLTCEVHDLPFVQESKLITTDVNSALSQLLSLEEIILSHKEEVARVEKETAILKEFLIEEMKKSDVKKWETDKIIATYVASTKRIGVDSKKLKDDYPEIFAEVAKESEVKESLRIKIN